MPTLEVRVRHLERRLTEVERLLEVEPAPPPAPKPTVAAKPRPAPKPPARRPDPRPRRSLEVDVGRWLLSWLIALSLLAPRDPLGALALTQGVEPGLRAEDASSGGQRGASGIAS